MHVSSAIAARCAAGRGRKRQGAGCTLVIQSKRGPQATNGRSESGHWEADTVAGKTGPSCLIDPACRKSRILLSLKFPKGTSGYVRNGIIQLLGPLPPERVRPIAPERDKEFSRHAEISAALGGVPFYFPPPHAPWARHQREHQWGLFVNTARSLLAWNPLSHLASRYSPARLICGLANAWVGNLPLKFSSIKSCTWLDNSNSSKDTPAMRTKASGQEKSHLSPLSSSLSLHFSGFLLPGTKKSRPVYHSKNGNSTAP